MSASAKPSAKPSAKQGPLASPSREGASAPPAPGELRAIALFAEACETVLERLGQSLERRTLRARAVLGFDASLRGKAGFVRSGVCRLMAVSPGGASLCLQRLQPGDHFELASALAGGEPLTGLRIVGVETAELVFAPAPALADAAALCPRFAAALIEALAATHQQTAWKLFEFTTLDLRARLLGQLLHLGEAGALQRGVIVIDKPPTQRELAETVGAAREGVARQLGAFADEGLIERSAGRLTLLDVRRMLEQHYALCGRSFSAYAPGGRLAGPWFAQGGIGQQRRGNVS